MSRAAWSMFLFGSYLVVAGSALVVAPALTASILGFQPPGEGGGFLRVTGMLVLNLAYMCFVSARFEQKDFMRYSVVTRSANFFLVWPFLVLENKFFLIFGVLDLVGAQWTRWALARDREAGLCKQQASPVHVGGTQSDAAGSQAA